MKTIDENLRGKIALRTMNATNKSLLMREYNLAPQTVYDCINGKRKVVQNGTFNRLSAYANETPIVTDESGDEAPKAEIKSNAPIPPSQPATKLMASMSETVSPKSNTGIDAITFLKDQVHVLTLLYRMQKELIQTLIYKTNNVVNDAGESAKKYLDQFKTDSEDISKKLENLDQQFQTMDRRHKYLSRQYQDLEERVKKIEIRENPTKFRK